jgi:hypothetical protein
MGTECAMSTKQPLPRECTRLGSELYISFCSSTKAGKAIAPLIVLATCAERWLTPGTEYAILEKLPLPREWYKGWDLSSPSATPGAATGLTEADMGDSTVLSLPKPLEQS